MNFIFQTCSFPLDFLTKIRDNFPTLKQSSFLPTLNISRSTAHGGGLRAGKRKIARPFDPKRPIHIVLRSSRAKGHWSMLRHKDVIEQRLDQLANKYRIRLHRIANVGNHLHLLVSLGPERNAQRSTRVARALRIGETRYERSRARFSGFLRELAGTIAMAVTRASKIKPAGRFWDALAFTRMLHWGREFEAGMLYLVKNLFEAAGLWNRKKHPDWEIGWAGT